MPVEQFANLATTTVSSGGTTAPSSGTQETWTVASSAGFPTANSGASPPTQFHVADVAPGKSTEIIAVTNVSGTTWTVTRGAESSTPVAHAVGFVVMIDLTAGGLSGMLQAASNLSDVAARQTAMNNLAGAVTSGDYLRGNGSNVAMSAIQAGDVPQLADYAPTGLTGATAASRYVGATASGAPASGTFAVGDFCVDQTGAIWICTVAGTPGTWVKAGPTIPVSIAQGGTGQATAAAALAALGGAAVAGDIGGTSASPQVTGTHLASPLPIAQGGTSGATQQAALDALAGAVTSGLVLRGNGTHVLLAALQAGDIPQLADYAPTGLTGATAASRYAGATASGAPASGTFAVGDFTVDQTGKIWICTTAGTPGTWTSLGTVTGVTAADTSVVVGGTAAAPTVRTNTLDVIAADHPPAADWSNNSHKITSLANGTASTDAAAFGQIPVIDSTAGDIQALGAQAAGSTGKAADAGHVHPATGVVLTSSLPLAIGSGGTGQATQQAAIDALAGAVTSGLVLRGNGTHVVLAAIQAGDLPDLAYVDTVSAADSSITITGATDTPSVASVPAQYAQRIFAV